MSDICYTPRRGDWSSPFQCGWLFRRHWFWLLHDSFIMFDFRIYFDIVE